MTDSKKMSVILFSYVPLLDGPPGLTVENPDPGAMTELLEAMPSGQALACIWVGDKEDPNKISPIFLYEEAEDLVDHLIRWAENEPLKWFDLHLKEKDGKYVLALVPKVEKSVERYKIAYQMKNGYPMPKDVQTNIIFRSLHMVSGGNSVFSQHKDKVGDTLKIGFLNSSRVNPNDMKGSMLALEDSDIQWIGPFKLASNDIMGPFLDTILKDAEPTVKR